MDTGDYRILKVDRSGPCLFVDAPSREWDADAMSCLAADLVDVCGQLAWMGGVRVVLLSFEGNIQDLNTEDLPGVPATARLAEPIAEIDLPVVAAIQGDALGPGLELALACDIRIGTTGARYGLPQVAKGGMPVNGGTQRLPRLIGPGPAMQMILTGEPIDANEALRTGLLHRVVPAEQLISTAREMARTMGAKSALSMIFAKEALYSAMDLTLDQGLSKELDLYLQMFGTDDRTEGISAFREKRSPEFKRPW